MIQLTPMPPVIILAGGKGTRLASVVNDRPKILAPIKGRPFMDYLLFWLGKQSVKNICFSLGFKAQQVIEYLPRFNSDFDTIDYVVEREPLGTAGGVAYCLHNSLLFEPAPRNCRELVVINGDSWVTVDLISFIQSVRKAETNVSLCAVRVNDSERYGQLDIDETTNTVIRFNEKCSVNKGQHAWVNAGIYYFRGAAIEKLASLTSASIELDFFAKLSPGDIYAYRSDADFVDIGTPESYQLAEKIIQSVE